MNISQFDQESIANFMDKRMEPRFSQIEKRLHEHDLFNKGIEKTLWADTYGIIKIMANHDEHFDKHDEAIQTILKNNVLLGNNVKIMNRFFWCFCVPVISALLIYAIQTITTKIN